LALIIVTLGKPSHIITHIIKKKLRKGFGIGFLACFSDSHKPHMWVALHLRAQRESSADGGSGVPRILELDFANGHSVGGIIYNGKNQGFPNLGKWPCIKRGMSRK
jgi:hypothetical protein